MNYLGFDKYQTDKTAKALNKLLASYQVYYQNLRNFHWNVGGENFFDLHAKFEERYKDARVKIDEIAERILTLRHRPMSNMSDYLSATEVEEAGEVHDDREMVGAILKNHGVLIALMRKVLETAGNSNDEGTIDMISGFLSGLEKESWMLDAWYARKAERAEV
ncbi:MAG TPA: Dps family protein [Flavilitoribacter sp.]|nr:Dps family protein [Flavilitoribacter sp.]HMQ88233.1 Dps family protein [Flavilitoribacter sp.]